MRGRVMAQGRLLDVEMGLQLGLDPTVGCDVVPLEFGHHSCRYAAIPTQAADVGGEVGVADD
jgi:hypothetical protein